MNERMNEGWIAPEETRVTNFATLASDIVEPLWSNFPSEEPRKQRRTHFSAFPSNHNDDTAPHSRLQKRRRPRPHLPTLPAHK